MFKIDKVQFSNDSGFDTKRAMELANLISVTYNEYEVWDSIENSTEQKTLPSNSITGSNSFISLQTDDLENIQGKNDSQTTKDYQWLDHFWQQKPDQVKTYTRLDNFWFPQWWWGEVLKPENLLDFFKEDIRDIWQNLEDLIGKDQIFGFIARSQTNPNQIFVVFRGTREPAEWVNNFRPKPKAFLEDGMLGEVRNGFNLIYTSKRDGIDLNELFSRGKEPENLTIEKTIAKVFEKELNEQSEIFVTGHSLGAGLATLAALHIYKIAQKKNLSPSIQLYTFASPRVGDEKFASYFDSIQSYRVINSEDLIQSIPLPTTEVIDDEIKNNMPDGKKARFLAFKAFLEFITGGQSGKHYQHVGLPITFTKQTGTIAGNHNLTKTYREALDI